MSSFILTTPEVLDLDDISELVMIKDRPSQRPEGMLGNRLGQDLYSLHERPGQAPLHGMNNRPDIAVHLGRFVGKHLHLWPGMFNPFLDRLAEESRERELWNRTLNGSRLA
jgi:hypothetical protein